MQRIQSDGGSRLAAEKRHLKMNGSLCKGSVKASRAKIAVPVKRL